MAFEMTLWHIDGDKLNKIEKSHIDKESRLEEWIDKDPAVLGLDLLIIGRQVQTSSGAWIDLLGMNRQGDIVILELKRDKTPRDIVAQVLDYASWVNDLNADEIENIAEKYLGRGLAQAFSEYYEMSLPDNINTGHSMVIVASEMDDSTERIVQYLSSVHNVNINVVFFNYFKHDNKELLGRAWMMDPESVEERSRPKKRVQASGYLYFNVHEDQHRNWNDFIKYGFLSTGQKLYRIKQIQKIEVGSKVFAYMSYKGYVGYREVLEKAVKINDFIDTQSGQNILSLPLEASDIGENKDNPELCEWVLKMKWEKVFTRNEGKTFKGIEQYPTIVTSMKDPDTLAFLQKEFGVQ